MEINSFTNCIYFCYNTSVDKELNVKISRNPANKFSNSTIETLEKSVKYVQR